MKLAGTGTPASLSCQRCWDGSVFIDIFSLENSLIALLKSFLFPPQGLFHFINLISLWVFFNAFSVLATLLCISRTFSGRFGRSGVSSPLQSSVRWLDFRRVQHCKTQRNTVSTHELTTLLWAGSLALFVLINTTMLAKDSGEWSVVSVILFTHGFFLVLLIFYWFLFVCGYFVTSSRLLHVLSFSFSISVFSFSLFQLIVAKSFWILFETCQVLAAFFRDRCFVFSVVRCKTRFSKSLVRSNQHAGHCKRQWKDTSSFCRFLSVHIISLIQADNLVQTAETCRMVFFNII